MAILTHFRDRSVPLLALTIVVVALLSLAITSFPRIPEAHRGEVCCSLQVEPPLRVKPGDSLGNVRQVFPSMRLVKPEGDGGVYACDDTTIVIIVNGSVTNVSLIGSQRVCGLHIGDSIARAIETLGHPMRRRVRNQCGNPSDVTLEYPLLGLNVYADVRTTQSPSNASIMAFEIVKKSDK